MESVADLCRRHAPNVSVEAKDDHERIRAVLTSRPHHRWDAFLFDVLKHLASKRPNVRYSPTRDDIREIKLIFDMESEHVAARHLTKKCRVSTEVGRAWGALLWFDRLRG